MIEKVIDALIKNGPWGIVVAGLVIFVVFLLRSHVKAQKEHRDIVTTILKDNAAVIKEMAKETNSALKEISRDTTEAIRDNTSALSAFKTLLESISRDNRNR